MLTELEIRNVGLVEDVSLSFGAGLQVFTGETGVGKSTVIRALKLLGGAKGSAVDIRTGAREAVVRCRVEIPADRPMRGRFEECLGEAGIPTSEDGGVWFERRMARRGSGSVRINGRRATVRTLRELTGLLMDIQGQNEHQELLSVSAQRAALDRFAELAEGVQAFDRDLQRYRHLRQEHRRLVAADEARRLEREELESVVSEIEEAEVQEGEFERLRAELKLLERAREIRESLSRSHAGLSESDHSVVESLQRWTRCIDASRDALPECGDLAGRLESACSEVQEVAFELVTLVERAEEDPERREEVLERLELLRGLLTRYGPFEADVLAHCGDARARLEAMGSDEKRLAELEQDLPPLEAALREQATSLAAVRRQSGERLATEIELDLEGLGMAGTRFAVAVSECDADTDLEDVAATSAGRVEFQVSANRGEGLSPLAAVASGGELARILLVLRERLADTGGVPILVFDEIDANVGGRLGGVLGERLQRIANRHQVLCVTHLAQLASFGEEHFKVIKRVEGERTVTRVEPLDAERRVDELAEMLAGSAGDGLARQQVQQMLSSAESRQAASGRRRPKSSRVACP
ncbi:MAG: DNA repair protein RecN [Planctomycetota bacterium]